jgi:hypothetical protein
MIVAASVSSSTGAGEEAGFSVQNKHHHNAPAPAKKKASHS